MQPIELETDLDAAIAEGPEAVENGTDADGEGIPNNDTNLY